MRQRVPLRSALPPDRRDPGAVWRLRGVLLANGLLRVASAAGGTLVGFYLAALAAAGEPIDAALVGTIGAVANGAEVVAAVPLGMLADRYAPRTVLVISTLIGALATQLFGISGVIVIFFVSRALESVAAVAGGPALLAHLADVTRHDPPFRSRVMSYYELSLLAGLALGGLIGGTLWDALHTYGFALVATLYLVAAALFWWGAAAVAPPARTTPLDGLRHALHDPLLRRLAPAWLAVNAIVGLWLTHVGFQLSGPAVAGQELAGGFSASEVGLILLGYGSALALGILAWSIVLAALPRVHVLRVALAALLVVCLMLALLNAPLAWPRPVDGALVLVLALAIMVGSGFTPAALAYLADLTGQHSGRGAALGIYTALFSLGAAAGAGLGGVLAQRWAFNGLILGTVLLVAVALAALLLLPAKDDAYAPRA